MKRLICLGIISGILLLTGCWSDAPVPLFEETSITTEITVREN